MDEGTKRVLAALAATAECGGTFLVATDVQDSENFLLHQSGNAAKLMILILGLVYAILETSDEELVSAFKKVLKDVADGTNPEVENFFREAVRNECID